MRVTAKKLVDAGAGLGCDALLWFKRRWPNGCMVTLKNLEEVAENDMYLLSWFVHRCLDDQTFSGEIETKEETLIDAWDSTVEKRYIESAEKSGRQFLFCQRPQKQTIANLCTIKRNYESARAAALVDIAHQLARMVYDKIKSGAGKKRRAK